MRTIPLFGIALVFLGLATGTSSAQFVVCQSGQQGQPAVPQTVSQFLEDRGLYLRDASANCWRHVKNVGLEEGTLRKLSPDDVQQFRAQGGASFAYLIAQSSYRTAVIVKERVFHPDDVIAPDDNKRPVSYAVPYVILKRAAVQSVCENKGDLDNFRRSVYRGDVKVDVNAYNRYHAQAYNFVPATDEIRQFHFKYPVGSACPPTDDPGTRLRYVLTGLDQDPSIPLISWALTLLTPPSTHNSYYSKLLVENRLVNGTETLLGLPNYTVVRFLGDAMVGTRSEITISDLQQQGKSTWQIDWK